MKTVGVTCKKSRQKKLVQIGFAAPTSTITQVAYFQEPIVTRQSNPHIFHCNAFLGVLCILSGLSYMCYMFGTLMLAEYFYLLEQ